MTARPACVVTILTGLLAGCGQPARVVTVLAGLLVGCGRPAPLAPPAPSSSASAPPSPSVPSATTRLEVEVGPLRTPTGRIYLALFDSPEAFPHLERAVRTEVKPADSLRVEVVLEGLAPGEYALLALHDENANGALDTGWLGIPSEGVGASNDAQGRFGPARYERARFTLPPGTHRVTVSMVYF